MESEDSSEEMADMFEEYVQQLKEPLSPAAFRNLQPDSKLYYNVNTKEFDSNKLSDKLDDTILELKTMNFLVDRYQLLKQTQAKVVELI
jgi:hypothetical protein